MSFTHTLSLKVTTAGRNILAEIELSDDGQTSRTIEVAQDSTDLLVNLAIDVSQIQSIYMKSDQDLTVKTNDSGAPDNTLNLLADQPYIWWSGCLFTNLLTVDITALYLTNTAAATLEIEVVVDSTP